MKLTEFIENKQEFENINIYCNGLLVIRTKDLMIDWIIPMYKYISYKHIVDKIFTLFQQNDYFKNINFQEEIEFLKKTYQNLPSHQISYKEYNAIIKIAESYFLFSEFIIRSPHAHIEGN